MMKELTNTIKHAFPLTVPVLTGFLFLGTAYGILMTSKGFNSLFTIATSVFVFAGSLQFVGVELLCAAFNPLNAFLMGLMINARQLFYGISMIDKYKCLGRTKPLAELTLCDETFSILCTAKAPEGIDNKKFILCVSVMNYLYWVTGTAVGATVGNLITFDTTGIDFSLTALFVVIFVNQWKENKDHIPALLGLACSAVCVIVFGTDKFIIPSMAFIIVSLIIYRKPFERTVSRNA